MTLRTEGNSKDRFGDIKDNLNKKKMTSRYLINKNIPMLALLMIVSFASAQLSAQQIETSACPPLDEGAQLNWEHQDINGSDLCRAMRTDGSEAFGMYISQGETFTPDRKNRSNKDMIGQNEVQWYRGELAGRLDTQVRETFITLGSGRFAHIWIHAESQEQLERSFQIIRNINISSL